MNPQQPLFAVLSNLVLLPARASGKFCWLGTSGSGDAALAALLLFVLLGRGAAFLCVQYSELLPKMACHLERETAA